MTVCIRDLDDKKSRKPIVRNFLNDTSSTETETVPCSCHKNLLKMPEDLHRNGDISPK